MLPTEVTAELNKLHDLRMSKTITQAEYDKYKKELFRNHGIKAPKKERRPGGFLVFCVFAISMLVGVLYGSTPLGREYGGVGGVILGTMIGLFLYLLPAFIAYQRSHLHRHAILILNIFAGWSFIGWVVALIWSATSARSEAA